MTVAPIDPLPELPGRRPRRLSPRAAHLWDLALTGVLLLGVAAMVVARLDPLHVLLSAAQIAPLLVRRTHPLPAFLTVAAASALQVPLIDEPVWGQVAFPIAVYSAARFGRAWHGHLALAVGICAAAVAAYDWSWSADPDVLDSTFWANATLIAVIVVACWALGTLARVRRAYIDQLERGHAQLRADAQQRIELAAADERARIAREMHDVVAHGLSVIVVQADGARYAAARDPEVATRTLGTIAATARESLTQMRGLLGLLRTGEPLDATAGASAQLRPQPTLGDLDELLATVEGLHVDATLPDPLPEVSPGVGLAVYRTVQESLTNVRKHAAAGRVEVRVADEGTAIVVEVHDDGRGAATAVSDDGEGQGLRGMRERVAALGGEVTAGPAPGGGWRVRARIPLAPMSTVSATGGDRT
ncbi:sensor histidine kinase [Nocardioides massiliensis]|uniref:histidine kinase n=1 Tax=Nocardioides massiliensis TaxID=1325935 RepID=A0ABT9NKP8_9ACTN|nr:sensor histidine kinase [Nocardioides massiliensis]MDP9820984.1 signal transduction histidine kinase [Nocardioides massiliensis]